MCLGMVAMTDDPEILRLRARVGELETLLAAREATDEIRELEYRSLIQDVAVKAAYIAKLEKAHEEVVVPKDVHIRNLEAMIAQLSSEGHEVDASQPIAARSLGRLTRKLRG